MNATDAFLDRRVERIAQGISRLDELDLDPQFFRLATAARDLGLKGRGSYIGLARDGHRLKPGAQLFHAPHFWLQCGDDLTRITGLQLQKLELDAVFRRLAPTCRDKRLQLRLFSVQIAGWLKDIGTQLHPRA